MDTKSAIKPFINPIKAGLFKSDVEKTMAEHYSAPPPNSLEPTNIWKERIERELIDLYSGQAAIDKAAMGYDAIAEDLRSHLSPKEFDKIYQEWSHGVERWISFVKSAESKSAEAEIKAECLGEMMGISEGTLVNFYAAGNRYFSSQNFEKASNAFYVVVTLDHRRYNAWIAYALSEMKSQHWEQAIFGFAMGSITNIDSPYPYMYAADCCLHCNRIDEAKVYLNLAKEALEKSQLANKQLLMASVTKLQQSLK